MQPLFHAVQLMRCGSKSRVGHAAPPEGSPRPPIAAPGGGAGDDRSDRNAGPRLGAFLGLIAYSTGSRLERWPAAIVREGGSWIDRVLNRSVSCLAAHFWRDVCHLFGIATPEGLIWWPRSFYGSFRRAAPVALPVLVPVGPGAWRRSGRMIPGGGLRMRRNVRILPILIVALAAITASRAWAQNPPNQAAPAPAPAAPAEGQARIEGQAPVEPAPP